MLVPLLSEKRLEKRFQKSRLKKGQQTLHFSAGLAASAGCCPGFLASNFLPLFAAVCCCAGKMPVCLPEFLVFRFPFFVFFN